ncbi:AraC family transcriptional regulator [Myceligenerans salitolerans]|uniref:AraC family transcriptional regulator n=1 Tax=Myceligenerans salitolerans TaxID=1230528 RepID=A0ABS3IAG5_9MICO|nr:helix-turn-helix domain-containing protein [Myceligenerans salitolerans]MBO0609935.1 AraC family transcriptional regulator [Myceligenerans salitolerans]
MRHTFEPATSPGDVLGAGPTLGIVNPAEARARFRLTRVAPVPDLADLVDWHWVITWDLPPGLTFTQTVVPHPVGNVVAEDDGILAHAMPAGLFERALTGTGRVVGTKLRPGGFRALLGLSGPGHRGDVRQVGPPDVMAHAVRESLREASSGRAEAAAGAITPLLRAVAGRHRTPRSTAALGALREVFAAITDAAPGATVASLAGEAGTTPRTLQRLFAGWVGVSPKWVLRRHRLHLAAELLGRDPGRDLAEVAAVVGYYDQAHFTGDFARAIGVAPGEYARRCTSAAALGR